MKWNTAQAVSAGFALALAALLAGQAHASCGEGKRIKHDDAGCLDAKWDNNMNFWSEGRVQARNKCSSLGKLVVKVDIKAGSDYTWHLSNGETRRKDTGGYDVRQVYCCTDLSDLCDKSEINATSCLDLFRGSSANNTCVDASASINYADQCVIAAQCPDSNGDYTNNNLAVHWLNTDDLHNCDGTLRVAGC